VAIPSPIIEPITLGASAEDKVTKVGSVASEKGTHYVFGWSDGGL